MSFERIPVQVGDRPGERVAAQALLVPELRVVAAYGGGEFHLRLPGPAAAGELVALRRDPPSDAVFELLAEERDADDRPLWRARLADQNSAPVVAARRQAEQAAARGAARPAADGLGRVVARRRAQAERVIAALGDEELRALVDLLEGDLSRHVLAEAAGQRLAPAAA